MLLGGRGDEGIIFGGGGIKYWVWERESGA